MTEPREPDRSEETGTHGIDPAPRDWRGAWKQAADGSWYQDIPSQRSESPISPDQPASHDEPASQADSPGRDDERPAPHTPAPRSGNEDEHRPQEPEPKRARSKWATAGFVVVAGVLVVALVRALVMGSNQGGVSTQGPTEAPAKPPILLGGTPSLTSPPLITLDPGLVRQGAPVAITGIGFDPGAAVDLRFTPEGSTQPIPMPGAQVAPDGSFGSSFLVPQLPNANGGTITANERGSAKIAHADAQIQAGVGFMALNAVYGKPGDVIGVTANGFQPGERIDAYWGRIGGPPAAQLQADQGGGLLRAPLNVGVAPAGNASLILVGEQTKTTATAEFSMGSLYPNAGVRPYAVPPASPFSIGGNGFMPGERVLLYINNSSGPPVRVLQADERGSVGGATFVAPSKLRGKQTLELVGEQSRATAMTGFQTEPYSPMAQPSTWGGRPGTSMSFYARGYAPNEVVLVYANRTPTNPGELVTAFRADPTGSAFGAGRYTIPGDAHGPMSLQLVGRESEATATATLTIQNRPGANNVPPTPKYVLPPELATDPPLPGDK